MTHEPNPLTTPELQKIFDRVKKIIRLPPEKRLAQIVGEFQALCDYLETIKKEMIAESFANDCIKIVGSLICHLSLLDYYEGRTENKRNSQLQEPLRQRVPWLYPLYDCFFFAFELYNLLLSRLSRKLTSNLIVFELQDFRQHLAHLNITTLKKDGELFLYRENVLGLAFRTVTETFTVLQLFAQHDKRKLTESKRRELEKNWNKELERRKKDD
ncbi:MAG: hypothetical protein GF308_21930 [Candidatus Heimdallarchaeota archaeon]|nr:hypothetical protein [Candidatus Heimdallarchaeota archaeon]